MILYGALGAISPALEEAAQTLRASRGARVPHGDVAAAAAGARQRVPARASSKASPTSAIRSCSPATTTCCRRRSSSPSPARSTTRAARRCSPSVLLGLTLRRVLAAAALARPLVVRHRQRQGRRRHAGAAAARRCGSRASGIAAAWIVFTIVCYVVILIGGFVKDIGRGDMTLTLHHFGAGLRHRLGHARAACSRLGVEQPVQHRRRSRRSRRR